MEKGRSVYNFQIICDINKVNELIRSYLSGNEYKIEQNNGETYYRNGDSMSGCKYFNYSIDNNTLTIYAWIKGLMGELKVEQNGLSSINIAANEYRDSLNILFKKIEELNTENSSPQNIIGYDPNTGSPIYATNENNTITGYDPYTGAPIYGNKQNNQFTQNFHDKTMKQKEKLCNIGFWLSLIGLVTSFIGVYYGIVLYFLNFYFASQGLKTRFRKKAIASIILSILSILVMVIEYILIIY